MIRYRPEINGLRAIAVTAVILDHAGAPLHGGYLGVDVFFVISGFLITSILMRDLDTGRFSLPDFYVRRTRRILPVLLAVVLVSLPFAWALMPPEQFRGFGGSLMALPVFATNFYFWNETGYFAPAADEIPMLHTWSLAVEEQFYIFFPLLLLLLWPRLSKPGLTVALICLTGTGLLLAEMLVRVYPMAAFFLLPARAWELAAGAAAATVFPSLMGRLGRGASDALAGLGLLLILASLVLVPEKAATPGLIVVPLIAGSVAVLLFATEGTRVARLMSRPAMIWIGLVSYSAYLWHQPVFAFVRIGSFLPPSPVMMAAAIALTFALSWVSFHLVEEPFRRRLNWPLVRRVVTIGFAGVFVFGLGIQTAYLGDERFPPERQVLFASATSSPYRKACHTGPGRSPSPEAACVLVADVPPGWAVLGDSHGIELAYALGLALEPRGESVVSLTSSGCGPAYAYDSEVRGCAAWARRSVDWLASETGIETVVIAYRHTAYLFDQFEEVFPKVERRSPRRMSGAPDAELRDIYWASFADLVGRLRASGKRVVAMAPVPEIGRPIDKYILFGEAPDLPTIPRHVQDDWIADIPQRLERLDVEIVRPTDIFCDADWCYGALGNEALYFDDDHMSVAGALRVVEKILE